MICVSFQLRTTTQLTQSSPVTQLTNDGFPELWTIPSPRTRESLTEAHSLTAHLHPVPLSTRWKISSYCEMFSPCCLKEPLLQIIINSHIMWLNSILQLTSQCSTNIWDVRNHILLVPRILSRRHKATFRRRVLKCPHLQNKLEKCYMLESTRKHVITN